MSFFLVRLEAGPDGKMIDVPIPDYGPYDKGPEAAKFAKALSDTLGVKVQPRRSSQAPDWRARQEQRLADGSLTRLPAGWDLDPIKDHFAHLNMAKHPGMVCFTENDDLGIIDRVTVLTPGRYINRYYPGTSDTDLRRLIATIDPSGQLFLAWTPDEISRVYQEGPASCMDGKHNFDTPVWPTAVYGAGDLAVAYTMNNVNRIQSRALVWPAKKIYGRVYGDVARMEATLQGEGYETHRDGHSVDDNGSSFTGAKLLKVFFDNDHNAVMPYFDDLGLCIDGGDHWIAVDLVPQRKDKDHPDLCYSGSTCGYSAIKRWCPKQQDYFDKSGFRHVHGVEQEWSQVAIGAHTFTCHQTGEVWPRENRVQLRGGIYVSERWFEANGAVCQGSGEKCRASDLVEYEGKKVHRTWIETDKLRKAQEKWEQENPEKIRNPFEPDWYGRRRERERYERDIAAYARDHYRPAHDSSYRAQYEGDWRLNDVRRDPTVQQLMQLERERQYHLERQRALNPYRRVDEVMGLDLAAGTVTMIEPTITVTVDNDQVDLAHLTADQITQQLQQELTDRMQQMTTDLVMGVDGTLTPVRRRVA
jgi:hypothetical protein